jgi:hypothetical protein
MGAHQVCQVMGVHQYFVDAGPGERVQPDVEQRHPADP